MIKAKQELIQGYRRYELVRRLSAKTFADVFQVNIKTGKPFDEIIDELMPFYQIPDVEWEQDEACQACAEIKAMRKALQDILNAIPKVCDWDAADQFYENGLIDENGNPTKLLTGD